MFTAVFQTECRQKIDLGLLVGLSMTGIHDIEPETTSPSYISNGTSHMFYLFETLIFLTNFLAIYGNDCDHMFT